MVAATPAGGVDEVDRLLDRAASAKSPAGALSRVASYVGAAAAGGDAARMGDLTRVLVAGSNDERFAGSARAILDALAVVAGRAGDTLLAAQGSEEPAAGSLDLAALSVPHQVLVGIGGGDTNNAALVKALGKSRSHITNTLTVLARRDLIEAIERPDSPANERHYGLTDLGRQEVAHLHGRRLTPPARTSVAVPDEVAAALDPFSSLSSARAAEVGEVLCRTFPSLDLIASGVTFGRVDLPDLTDVLFSVPDDFALFAAVHAHDWEAASGLAASVPGWRPTSVDDFSTMAAVPNTPELATMVTFLDTINQRQPHGGYLIQFARQPE